MLEVLGNPRFRAVWYVISVAEVTRWMELLVTSVLVYSLTDSSLMLGLVLAFENLPRPLFSPFTGIIADRFDRKKIWFSALAIKLAAAVALLFLLAMGHIAPWHVFGSMFLQGVSRALEDPARRTALFDIVGERRVVNALSIDSVSMTAGRMLGPFAGGFFVENLGYVWPHYAGYVWAYGVIVALHIVAVALALRVRIPLVQREWRVEPIWHSLGDAVRTALAHRQLVGMLFITIMINGMAFPARQFVPAIGRDHLRVGETLVGLLAASEAIGQLIMAGALASVGADTLSRADIRRRRLYGDGHLHGVRLAALVRGYLCDTGGQRHRAVVLRDDAERDYDAFRAARDAGSDGGADEPVHWHRHAAGGAADGLAGRPDWDPVVGDAECAGVHRAVAAGTVF